MHNYHLGGMHLTVDEAAAALRTHRNTIYRKVRQGQLPASKVFGRILIDKKALMKLIEQSRVAPGGTTEFRLHG